jgi:DNA-directed RNA polymerase subunit RPC12/RpoP
VCMRCGEAFKAIRSDAMYCNNCKGKKKWKQFMY